MCIQKKCGVRDEYDNLGGKLYDIRYRHEQESKNDLILKYIGPLPGGILLDDGCGIGLLLSRFGSYSVGIDFSSSLLSTARAQLKEYSLTHLAQGDADSLPFRSTIFDNVFAVTLIQNTPDPTKTLREIRRVSKPGSMIVITALKKSFTIEELEKLIRGSGLALNSVIREEGIQDWIAFVTTNV